jgi:hypothetical protein
VSTSDRLICDIYRRVNVPADRLPYTDAFIMMHHDFESRAESCITLRNLWLRVCSLRKKGLLPRLRG